MQTEITNEIKVSVVAEYEAKHSISSQQVYVFSYQVTIVNNSNHTFQVKERLWSIFDSLDGYKEVQGEGVVGEQPVLEPGESFEYVSGCKLKSDIGSMCGAYIVERMLDGKYFEVEIPEFSLMVPFKLN